MGAIKILILGSLLYNPTQASKGLFMSPASANASNNALNAYLQSAGFACSPPWNITTSPMHITSVSLQAVADRNGKLYEVALERMLPVLSCVPELFVGTTIPHAADFYCGKSVCLSLSVCLCVCVIVCDSGLSILSPHPTFLKCLFMLTCLATFDVIYTVTHRNTHAMSTSRIGSGQVVFNKTFTKEAIEISTAAAKAFVTRFPDAPSFAWYISPEQFLNYLAEGCFSSVWGRQVERTVVAAAWADFLGAWTAGLAGVKPGTRILWSPAAPEVSKRSSNATAAAMYADGLTASLRTIAAAVPLLDTIVVQDSIGKASNASNPSNISYPVNCLDASWHANITHAAFDGITEGMFVGINMEMFLRKGHRVPASAIVDLAADPRELREREVCYNEQGLTIGPSWDARFWLEDLTQVWVP